MKIKGLIIGSNIGEIVRDGRTLKAMARKDLFKYPVDDSDNPYVDEENRPRMFNYKDCEYSIEYKSGCFFPFVVKKT